MLDETVNSWIGQYNFERHLARYQGRLLSALGDKVSEPMYIWNGYPYHKLYFTCNDSGFLCKLGARQDFSETEIERYNFGRFNIAVDQAQVDAARKAGSVSIDFPYERIINVGFYKGIPPKAYHRIKETAALYNGEFGFDPSYNSGYHGFTAENVLDEGDLL
ncbi:MAG: hypothetical protein Q7S55_03945 [Nanoarchaeota archaeon]|nr:hypothetical protein [Nanoarchaeota archaeon]